MTVNELYEPMLARDIAGIASAARRYRQDHTSEELFRAVSQFALLAASPSQHGKHALLSCVAAKEIEAFLGDRFDEMVIECARYTALARLPWSEAPITEPPDFEPRDARIEVLRDAVANRDRLQGERWLAARLASGKIARDFFAFAAEDLSDFGHKLIVAVAVWKLAAMHERPESFVALRVAVGEWTAYSDDIEFEKTTIDALVAGMIAERGSLESFHRLVTADAAIEAAQFAGDPSIIRDIVATSATPAGTMPLRNADAEAPIYSLGRDYAEYLKAFAIAQRLGRPEIIPAAKYNRDHGPSFEEWSSA